MESSAGARPVRIMTFNLKYDAAEDPLAAWSPQRRDAAVALIRACDPDVLGLQEVLRNQLDDLATALPGYAAVGEGRDGGSAGEHCPVLVRRSRFDVPRSGTFWLSPSPERPSSLPGASFPRVCTWAELSEHDGAGAPGAACSPGTTRPPALRVWNTHLDHESDALRTTQVEALLARLHVRGEGDWEGGGSAPRMTSGSAPLRPARTVVMGDLNAPLDSEPLRALTAVLRNTREHAEQPPTGPAATFHDWDPARVIGTGPDHPDRIDHVLVSDDLAVLSYDVPLPDERLPAGIAKPSDHHAVVVEITTA